MQTYGLIGYPVKHSLSPAMHNAAFRALGIDAEYKLFEAAPQNLQDFLTLKTRDILGLNVTVPHKEPVFKLVSFENVDDFSRVFSHYARSIGAVNTIVKDRGKSIWRGFNTDVPGFLSHLRSLEFEPKGRRVALLGAGGAGKAVAFALASEEAAGIVLFDTDPAKADMTIDFVRRARPGFNISRVDSIGHLRIGEKDLLVNATPVGMNAGDPLPVPREDLHAGLFVYDLIYNPARTALIEAAAAAGARTSNGLGMLLYQGVWAFELFTGRSAPVDVMRAALEEGIKKL